MAPTINGLILEFRPWIWARTTLYEYYCMSWATRLAAEYTRHPPLAARLVGESFELAVKVLHILIQGPGEGIEVRAQPECIARRRSFDGTHAEDSVGPRP